MTHFEMFLLLDEEFTKVWKDYELNPKFIEDNWYQDACDYLGPDQMLEIMQYACMADQFDTPAFSLNYFRKCCKDRLAVLMFRRRTK